MTPRALTLLLVLPALACSQAPGHAQAPARGAASAHEEAGPRFADVARVVVVADVHGARSALIDILVAAELIDSAAHWSGGASHLVSLGDLLDRGPDSRGVLDLLMRLQGEAAAQGGRVHVVLGNHEVMNLIGDLRYLTASDYAAFAAEETAAQRFAGYASLAPAGTLDDATVARFEEDYPQGYFARHEAFSSHGPYGGWLLSLPAIVVINDTAFVHGGLPPLVATQAVDALDATITTKLRRYLELRDKLEAADVLPIGDMSRDYATARSVLESRGEQSPPVTDIEEFLALADAPELGPDGPLWYRGSVYCKPLLERPTLEAALEELGVERVVVGHTPTGDRRARALYDGKLVMLDTGMLAAYYSGRPTALVVEGEQKYVQYAAPAERGTLEQGATAEPYPFSEAELIAALEQAAVQTVTRNEGGTPWAVTLTLEGAEVEGAFLPRSAGRAADLELAAATLDDLLGTALVPPTVARAIDGEDGALQLRYPRAVTETQRAARQAGFSGWCPIEPQLDLMRAFDLLTYNPGRTADNVLYRNELTDVVLTDHRNAFGTERALPAGLDLAAIEMPAALIDALRALDEPGLSAALGGRIDARRIRALLARRDQLLESR
jgi:hypothetical protein